MMADVKEALSDFGSCVPSSSESEAENIVERRKVGRVKGRGRQV